MRVFEIVRIECIQLAFTFRRNVRAIRKYLLVYLLASHNKLTLASVMLVVYCMKSFGCRNEYITRKEKWTCTAISVDF